MPAISIILPHIARNDPYLDECVSSILNQSFSDFELLLIDNTPGVPSALAASFVNHDSRIKYVFKDSLGKCRSRNLGIEMARGDAVCFIDSDDRLKSGYLELLFNCLLSNPTIGIVFCDGESLSTSGNISTWSSNNGLVTIMDLDDEFIFENAGRIGPWCHMVRRKSIGSVRFDEMLKGFEDRLFFFNLYFRERRIAHIAKSLYVYRANPTSDTCFRSIDWFSTRYLNKMYVSGEICDALLGRHPPKKTLRKALRADCANYLSYRWLMFSFRRPPVSEYREYKNKILKRNRRSQPIMGILKRIAIHCPRSSYVLVGRWKFGKAIRKPFFRKTCSRPKK